MGCIQYTGLLSGLDFSSRGSIKAVFHRKSRGYSFWKILHLNTINPNISTFINEI